MTINERLLYKNLYSKKEFSSSSKLILCSLIDQFLQLIDFLKDSKSTSTENTDKKSFARFIIDIEHGSIREIDLLNSEATTKYRRSIVSPKNNFFYLFRYNKYRSTFFPSIQTVKRQLCFEEEKVKTQSHFLL
jgi:hypothetical protein